MSIPAGPAFVFSSHDGYGLGHVRRNSLIARSLLELDPTATVTLVTGVRVKPSWLDHARLRVVQVPPMLKSNDGSYRHETMPFAEALAQRAAIFEATVAGSPAPVVIVDRHPFGVAGELDRGLRSVRAAGGRVILGLRDVLDEPVRIREELAGAGWTGVTDVFDEILVYGEREICDHVEEYGLPMEPTYCGWVTEPVEHRDDRDDDLIAVTAGGGGDGAQVFRLGVDLLSQLPDRRAVIVAGPYAHALPEITNLPPGVRSRLELWAETPACGTLFAAAGSVVQMAGYNSTFEALAAGIRPVLVPRRSPRREQAIRAARLAALGLADIVDEGSPADEVAWLLRRPRRLGADQLATAGIHLDGATRAAQRLLEHARERVA